MQMDFSDDNFAKMTPQYGETADDSQVDQVRQRGINFSNYESAQIGGGLGRAYRVVMLQC